MYENLVSCLHRHHCVVKRSARLHCFTLRHDQCNYNTYFSLHCRPFFKTNIILEFLQKRWFGWLHPWYVTLFTHCVSVNALTNTRTRRVELAFMQPHQYASVNDQSALPLLHTSGDKCYLLTIQFANAITINLLKRRLVAQNLIAQNVHIIKVFLNYWRHMQTVNDGF